MNKRPQHRHPKPRPGREPQTPPTASAAPDITPLPPRPQQATGGGLPKGAPKRPPARPPVTLNKRPPSFSASNPNNPNYRPPARPTSPHKPATSKPASPAKAPAPALPAPTHWSQAADWYDQLVGEAGSEYHQQVVLPGAIRLLAPQKGDTILDVACGQGVLCRLLASRGVVATGVDASDELIRLAKKREKGSPATPRPSDQATEGEERDEGAGMNDESTEDEADDAASLATSNSQLATPPAIRYHLGDARDLSFLPAAEFNAAACILGIQNIHPIGPVFRSVARVLKPMGKFVIVMMHPCFRGPKETSWGWDPVENIQYRRVDRYLIPRKAPIVTNPGISKDYTWTFHKPIGDYVKAARGAGLLVDSIEEWPSHKTSTSGPRAGAENTARKEIPMFLALRVVNIGKPEEIEATEEEATNE